MPDRGSALARLLRYATVALQLTLLGLVIYAIVRGSGKLMFNTLAPAAIAAIPLAVRYRYDYRLNPVLALLIVTAAVFHGFGALGLYQSIPWFDQLAHAVSGALVAGTGYALVQVLDTQYDSVVVPPKLRFVFVLVFAMAVGVVWELAEFAAELAAEALGSEPVLSQYSLQDVVLDFLFDGVGAVIVGIWGTSYFDGLRTIFDDALGIGDGKETAGQPGRADHAVADRPEAAEDVETIDRTDSGPK